MTQQESQDLIVILAEVVDRLHQIEKSSIERARSLTALVGAWCSSSSSAAESYTAQMRHAELVYPEHLADDLDREYAVLTERLRQIGKA